MAGVSFVVVVIALTIAFDLWISKLAGSIVGALAVAGVYLLVGVVAAVLALRPGKKRRVPAAKETAEAARDTDRGARIDAFTAPILSFLQRLGLKREQIAVLAGASVAKQLRPVPLVALAIVAGFLIGRLWKGWNALLSADLITALLGLLAVGRGPAPSPTSQDQPT